MATFEIATGLAAIPEGVFSPAKPVGEKYPVELCKAHNAMLAYSASPLCQGSVFCGQDVIVEVPPLPGCHAVMAFAAVGVTIKDDAGNALDAGVGGPLVLEWDAKLTTEYIRVICQSGGQYHVFPYAPTTPSSTILDEATGYLAAERYAAGLGLTTEMMDKLAAGIVANEARRKVLATLIYDGYAPKAGISSLCARAQYYSRGRPLQFSAHVRGDPGATITLRAADGTSVVLSCNTGLSSAILRSAESAHIPIGWQQWELEADQGAGLEIFSVSVYEGEA